MVTLQEIPAVPVSSEDPQSLAAAFDAAPSVSLAQAWGTESGFARTDVRLVWHPGALWVLATLDDADIFTKAGGDSERLWELGDVFEIFLEAEGCGHYCEMHIAPGNFRMHLRITDLSAMKKKKPEDFLLCPPRFRSETGRTDEGWSVKARIPAGEIGGGDIAPGSRWLASFCRYDAWSDGRAPVLSSTSPHSKINFHRREEWRPICF